MKRKSYSASLKARAALESIRGERTLNEIASSYGIHPTQLRQWKKEVLESVSDVFTDRHNRSRKPEEDLVDRLYQQIGQLKVKLDWLKKLVPAKAGKDRFQRLKQETGSSKRITRRFQSGVNVSFWA